MKYVTERNGKMRILVDTNILFSALVFPHSKPSRALLYIASNHEIILCDRNIAELRDILERKAPKYLPDADVLLAEMSYELIPAENTGIDRFAIRTYRDTQKDIRRPSLRKTQASIGSQYEPIATHKRLSVSSAFCVSIIN